MLIRVNDPALVPELIRACTHERVFGSRILTALRARSLQDGNAQFYLAEAENGYAALGLLDGVLVISAPVNTPEGPIAELVREKRVGEIDCSEELCLRLQKLLGGVTEHSYYMVYEGTGEKNDCPGIAPGKLEDVFCVLRQSHQYYRDHLDFDVWSCDLNNRLCRGLSELYQLEMDGKVVGTGSIASEDDECGVIAAVAVIPEYRHKGLGSIISRFLVQRILEKGKTPRLISGYDEVAELYRQIGFVPCGRWGELYL